MYCLRVRSLLFDNPLCNNNIMSIVGFFEQKNIFRLEVYIAIEFQDGCQTPKSEMIFKTHQTTIV